MAKFREFTESVIRGLPQAHAEHKDSDPETCRECVMTLRVALAIVRNVK